MIPQVTSSKTLYGGDMLVTTKIIQIMSEKMTYDIETFPDQRQREAIIFELLNGVIKTGSNLLDSSQQLSWIDLSFEDQMRVATALLTGLEDNAFLLADTIIREKNVVQKVKNIRKFAIEADDLTTTKCIPFYFFKQFCQSAYWKPGTLWATKSFPIPASSNGPSATTRLNYRAALWWRILRAAWSA
jgi:GPCR-Autoproteolysis INducing (GAIN) domain